jgi:hypothetical protein
MTWDEFKAALKDLGITQRTFAQLAGIRATSLQKWPPLPCVPYYAEALVGFMLAFRVHDEEAFKATLGELLKRPATIPAPAKRQRIEGDADQVQPSAA